MVVLPLARDRRRGVLAAAFPASGPIVQHLTLWVGFLGAAIAARDGKLLALATGTFIPPGSGAAPPTSSPRRSARAPSIVLAWGGWQMALIEREAGTHDRRRHSGVDRAARRCRSRSR